MRELRRDRSTHIRLVTFLRNRVELSIFFILFDENLEFIDKDIETHQVSRNFISST